jgi:hypothetical protein
MDTKDVRLSVNGRLVRRKHDYSPEAVARRAEKKRLKEIKKADCTEVNSKNNIMTQNQSIHITKSLIKGLGSEDRININYSPVMITQINDGPDKPVTDYKFKEFEDQLWEIIENLPPPKLENLRKFAFRVCLNKFSGRYAARTKLAKYLDMQRTYISKMHCDLKEDSLFGDETATICLPTNNE